MKRRRADECFEDYCWRLCAGIETMQWAGRVRDWSDCWWPPTVPPPAIGDFCEIHCSARRRKALVRAQVVGFRDGRVLLMPLEETGGLQPGDTVVARPGAARVEVGPQLLGRVLDGFGKPMDGGPPSSARGLLRSLRHAARTAGARAHHRAAGHRRARHR